MMHTRLNKIFILWIVGLWIAFFAGPSVFAQSTGNCGALSSPGQYGPYDYRTKRDQSLYLVESAHFTPGIEALIHGKSDKRPGPNIDYTLRAFPNHHRALMAMVRLSELEKSPKPNGSTYTVDCWFERAMLFRPDDTTVRMIFSSYLYKNQRVSEAVAQLEQAVIYAKDNSFTHYNIGLVYCDMKLHDKALVQAHKAMSLGFERTELRDLLKKAGQWHEPSTAIPPVPTASSTPAVSNDKPAATQTPPPDGAPIATPEQ